MLLTIVAFAAPSLGSSTEYSMPLKCIPSTSTDHTVKLFPFPHAFHSSWKSLSLSRPIRSCKH